MSGEVAEIGATDGILLPTGLWLDSCEGKAVGDCTGEARSISAPTAAPAIVPTAPAPAAEVIAAEPVMLVPAGEAEKGRVPRPEAATFTCECRADTEASRAATVTDQVMPTS